MSEVKDNKKIMAGMKQAMSACEACGRPRLRHTIKEANDCKKKLDDGTTPQTKVSYISDDYAMKHGHNFQKL